MRFVSPLLKRAVYPSLSKAGAFRRTTARGLAIVTYHGVLPPGYEPVDAALDGSLVSAETLRAQLRLLKSNYDLISPEDVLAWREGKGELPARAVLVTCDDGLLNHFTDMLPVLRQEAARCLFFVTGASAGERRSVLWYEELFLLFLRARAGPFEISSDGVVIRGEMGSREQRRGLWWNSVKRLSQFDASLRARFLQTARAEFGGESAESPAAQALNEQSLADETSPTCRRFALLNQSELRELAAAGMSIGAHTLSHPMLSQAPPELARAEIIDSRSELESVLQQRVWAFAYPFGDAQSVTPQIFTMAEEAGYAAAFLNYGGGLGTPLPPYALPRIHVTSEMSLFELDAHISGFHARLQRGLRG